MHGQGTSWSGGPRHVFYTVVCALCIDYTLILEDGFSVGIWLTICIGYFILANQ